MKPFLTVVAKLFLIPIVWIGASLLYQRLIYNPVGNPEAKHQVGNVQDADFIFIGPSVFHQRINEKALESSIQKEIELITSNGQSTLESLALAELAAKRAPQARIFIAGHDMKIFGHGLHQCWPCSNLPLETIKSDWNEVRECFWFDAILGLLAFGLHSSTPAAYATSDEELLSPTMRAQEAHIKFLEHADSLMVQMLHRVNEPREIPRFYLYEEYARLVDFQIISPPNGKFEKCPDNTTIPCFECLDSTWIDRGIWLDRVHLNHEGSERFTKWLEHFLSFNLSN